MTVDLTQRAKELDEMRLKHLADKLTLEEAQNIVYIWGDFLEHTGGERVLFGISIPESFLPYPINILQGALNKMEAYYHKQGLYERVGLLEGTESLLVQYTSDEEAIKEALSHFSNEKWLEAFIPALKDYQLTQMQAGFLLKDERLWKLPKSRVEELQR